MAQRWYQESDEEGYRYQIKSRREKRRLVEQQEEGFLHDPRIIPMDPELFELVVDNSPEGMHLELIDGILYNMAPPSDDHEQIKHNLFHLLRDQIPRSGSCRLLSEQYVKYKEEASMRPDITLTCDLA